MQNLCDNTTLRDIIKSMVGKQVIVFGHYAINGKLVAYNGYILHIHDDTDNVKNYYISVLSVEAIASAE